MPETNFHCVDEDGFYLGQFDGVPIPEGAIVVPGGPDNQLDKWNGTEWIPYVPDTPPTVYPSEVIIASPNGTPYKVMVDDDGTPATEPLI